MTTGHPTPIQDNVFPVSVSVIGGQGQRRLVFNPDPVRLTNQPNGLIVYTLATPGYYFPDDGTALVIDSADAAGEFPIAWIINATTLALGDYNNNAQTYKYTMTVVNSRTQQRVSTDPGIVNDNVR